nr:MAG TPA: hypothetical protein [Caudoviricetes sp.]
MLNKQVYSLSMLITPCFYVSYKQSKTVVNSFPYTMRSLALFVASYMYSALSFIL